jgi:hypothetical protein
MEGNVGAPRPAIDPDADDAECGCMAIGVARHTNAQHYGTREKAEAEARDVTGLREALEELLNTAVEVDVPHHDQYGNDAFVHAMTHAAMAKARAVLAAAPQEQRWPSAEDEAAIEALADARIAVSGEINPTPTDRRWWVEDSRQLLVRLHEAEQS